MEYNLRPRELWCPICKTNIFTKENGAICVTCNSNLITVLHSTIDGRRLTEDADELGPTSCRLT